MARFATIDDDSRDFDYEFWQTLGPAAIFEAAEEMIEIAAELKGWDESQLTLQRSVASFRPAWRPAPGSRRFCGYDLHGAEVYQGS